MAIFENNLFFHQCGNMDAIGIDKWTYPALFQEQISDNIVRCTLCPHNCVLRDGKYGICSTRLNIKGTLYTIAYGNPCSTHIDPIEKKPLFHFLPGTKIYSLATSGCNFRCLNCQNWEISQTSPHKTDHYDLTPEDIVRQALQLNIKSLAFTYTEPTVFYEYLLDTANIARQHKMRNVLISNGYINEKPLLELCQYLDAANIDLKCFDDKVYHTLTGGRLKPVQNTLNLLKEHHIWLEITNLLIPSYSDDPKMIQAMCNWLVANGFEETPLHFSRFFPTYKLSHLLPTAIETLIQAKQIAENAGIQYVYIGNIPALENENTFCPNCKKLIIERSGYRIAKNLIKNNRCFFCGETISGIWE